MNTILRSVIGSLCILSLVLTSCGQADEVNVKGLVRATEDFEGYSGDITKADLLDLSNGSIQSTNALGLELILSIESDQPEKNLLLSPTSLAFALAMVQNGAVGDTKEGVLKVLMEDEEGINDRYALLMTYLNSLEESTREEIPSIIIKTANALWLRQDLKPKQDFVDALKRYYDAGVYKADFTDPKTVDEMNKWVEAQTNHLLKDTIDSLDALTIAILMNTVYFKGTWVTAFEEGATSQKEFYMTEDQSVKVDMMAMTSNRPYFEHKDYRMTSLPYYGGSRMTLILPEGDLDEFLKDLSYEEIQEGIDEMMRHHTQVALSMPKLDYEVSNSLTGLLGGLGMEDAFSPVKADLSDMITIEGENVYISEVYQNARIIVDEAGTEAAAVTVMEFKTTSALEPEEPMVFNCNRPYIYMINDDLTGAALFIGIVKAP